MRSPIPQYRKTHVCAGCGKEFIAESYTSKACSPECRFNSYVEKSDGCWNWTGPKNTQNYGRLFLNVSKNGKRLSVAAHRHALSRIGVHVPADKCVMHKCDNPSCVNPSHLVVGTWGENNSDRSRKGRSGSRVYTADDLRRYSENFSGTKNPSAKLTEDRVREIRKDSRGSRTVGRDYGVSKVTVLRIRSGLLWKHVTD